ncbi:MAG: hypothetical protein RLZ25_1512 [Pseudomonadota bacterium]|jgi:hypothetical protein
MMGGDELSEFLTDSPFGFSESLGSEDGEGEWVDDGIATDADLPGAYENWIFIQAEPIVESRQR